MCKQYMIGQRILISWNKELVIVIGAPGNGKVQFKRIDGSEGEANVCETRPLPNGEI